MLNYLELGGIVSPEESIAGLAKGNWLLLKTLRLEDASVIKALPAMKLVWCQSTMKIVSGSIEVLLHCHT